MQLEQNIFSFHRMFLKIPRIIFYLLFGMILIVIFYETYNTFTLPPVNQVHNYSQLFLKYYKETRPPKQSIHNQGQKGDKVNSQKQNINSQPPLIIQNLNNQPQPKNNNIDNTNNQDSTKVNNDVKQQKPESNITIQFVNSTTYIELFYNQSSNVEPSYNLNAPKSNQSADIYITNTFQLVFLNRSPQFQQKHKVHHHAMQLGQIAQSRYILGNEKIYRNEIMYQSLKVSFRDLWSKIIMDKLFMDELSKNNDTIIDLSNLMSNIKIIYWNPQLYYDKFPSVINFRQWILFKLLYLVISYTNILLVSTFMGLFVRYSIITCITLYLMIAGSGTNYNWLSEYANVVRRNPRNGCCLVLWIGIAMFGMYGLLAIGSWWGLTILLSPSLNILLHSNDYCQIFIKTLFIGQLCHFLFSHTRTTIYFFPRLSTILGMIILFTIKMNPFFHTQYLLNLHLLVQILLSIIMITIQQQIIWSEFQSEYKPCFQKPRMIFYMGYELSWQKAIPPVWTYFTNWFDWSYVGEKQRVYIEGDYRLLYGMMMGMNQRHQLPEEEPIQPQDVSQLGVMRRQNIQ